MVYLRSLLVLLVLVALLVWQVWERGAVGRAIPREVIPRGDLSADESLTIALFRQASPSVVNITTLALRRDFFTLNLLERPKEIDTQWGLVFWRQ